MREVCEFRVLEKYAHHLFNDHEGKRLGSSIRQVKLATSDPKFAQIGALKGELKKQGASFFHGWSIRRYYTKEEFEAAGLFTLKHRSFFEPTGEECGTTYDESTCPLCGSGAKQVSELFLNLKRIPKSKDISKTIAGEIVVSRRLVNLFQAHSLQGAFFRPVRSSGASGADSKERFQLSVESKVVDLLPPTKTGIDPFDQDNPNEYRCTLGDLAGLAILSELWTQKFSFDTFDMVLTRQYFGVRRGLLRPQRVILISQKLRRILTQENINGFELEVAHLENV